MHEIVLGTDGQNPNQREPMLLCVLSYSFCRCLSLTWAFFRPACSREAHHGTQIKVGVWHKSQSKSKSKKKRHLVASTSLPLGEVVKKQGNDRRTLSCYSV